MFQTISRIAASGNTIVTTGAEISGGMVRQQFFTSANDGTTWRQASLRGPGGGPAPLGYGARGWPAARLAATGPAGCRQRHHGRGSQPAAGLEIFQRIGAAEATDLAAELAAW